MLAGCRQLTQKLKIFSNFFSTGKILYRFCEKKMLLRYNPWSWSSSYPTIVNMCAGRRASPLVSRIFFKTRDKKIDENMKFMTVCVWRVASSEEFKYNVSFKPKRKLLKVRKTFQLKFFCNYSTLSIWMGFFLTKTKKMMQT